MDLGDPFDHILQGLFTGTGIISYLRRNQITAIKGKHYEKWFIDKISTHSLLGFSLYIKQFFHENSSVDVKSFTPLWKEDIGWGSIAHLVVVVPSLPHFLCLVLEAMPWQQFRHLNERSFQYFCFQFWFYRWAEYVAERCGRQAIVWWIIIWVRGLTFILVVGKGWVADIWALACGWSWVGFLVIRWSGVPTTCGKQHPLSNCWRFY